MAEIRCPMCGKPNDDSNVECQHCGSRLKPLRLSEESEQTGAPAARQPPAETQPPASSDLTLLRHALRAEPPPEAELEAEPPAPSSDATLISRSLRSRFEPPAAPPEAEPEAEPPAQSSDATLISRSLRSRFEPPAPPAPAEPAPPPAPSAESGEAGATPAWLQRLRSQSGSPGPEARSPSQPTPPAPSAEPPARREPPAPPPGRRTTGELFRSLRTAAMRSATEPEPEEEEPEEAASEDVPAWLGALRKQSVPPPAAPPPAPEPEPEPEGPAGMPDWLRSLREQSAEPEAPAPAPAPPDAVPAAPAAEPKPEAENLDWLQQARAWEPAESAWPPAPAAESAPEAAPADDFPDWLKNLEAAQPAQPPAAEEFASAGQAGPADEMPDWLGALGQAPAEPAAPVEAQPEGGYPDWLRSLAPTAPAEPEAAPAAPASAVPDWLQSLPPAEASPDEETPGLPAWLGTLPPTQFGQAAETPPAPSAAAPAPPAAPAETPPAVEADLPDWLASLRSEAPISAASESPLAGAEFDFLTAPEPAGTPAEPPPAAEPAVEAEVELPEWLTAMRPAAEPDVAAPQPPQAPPTAAVPPFVPGPPAAAGATPSDLERATLPSWLEAMRPLPTAQPAAVTSAEYEETTGPLAGMKGVIAAEPAIALPTVRLAAAVQPTVSETHLAQVKLLQALVKEETAARPAPRGAGARPILALFERWIVFAILALVIIAPFALGDLLPQFSPPELFPVETVSARDVVANLPADRPVLVAIEYDPGAAGEMDLLSAALLDHLAARGLAIVTVSMRPLGPALAQAALETALPAEAGESAQGRYVNLGYLPGGVLSLPAFAADPRSLLAQGFLTESPDPEAPVLGVWQRPSLLGVHSLSDFGLIAVVSNSPDSVRAWIEQAEIVRRGAGGALRPPMIALVSASAEPLVHPYYLAESAAGSLQGLVSGSFGAASYAQLSGEAPVSLPSDISAQRWNAQALGLIAAVLFIGAGALLFGSFSLLQRRDERAP